MNREKNSILIFNIDNLQADYSKCLEFVSLIERYLNNKIVLSKEDYSRFELLINKTNILYNERENNSSPNYIEQPMSRTIPKTNKEEIIPPLVQSSKEISADDIMELIINRKSKDNLYYHIRIKIKNDSSIMNLQYLALLLQRLEYMFQGKSIGLKRISVFIAPLSNDRYPFADSNDIIDYSSYTTVSRYLRLLSKDYTGVIYGVIKGDTSPQVRAIDYKDTNALYNYFPLIPINEDSYNKLIKKLPNEKLSELFDLPKKRRYGVANSKDPREALEDFIAETSVRRFQYSVIGEDSIKTDEYKKICDEIHTSFYLGTSDCDTLLTFAIFTFIISISKNVEINTNIEMKIKEFLLALEIARNMAAGIKQAIQNVIQHSETKTGIFSFYLHQSSSDNKEDFINQSIHMSYPDTGKIYENRNLPTLCALEIFISDLNNNQTMLDNFSENIKGEYQLLEENDVEAKMKYSNLIDQGLKFAIRNLFDEYGENDTQNQWSEFRKMNSFKHTGLKEFSVVAQRCHASVKVISNKTYELQDDSLYFYRPYGAITLLTDKNDCMKYNKPFIQLNRMIPGTQFSILIPIVGLKEKRAISSGIAQLSNIQTFNETYSGFSKYIDFEVEALQEIVNFEETIVKIYQGGLNKSVLSVTNRLDKLKLIYIWKEFFSHIFLDCVKSNCIYYIDFNDTSINNYLTNADNMEVLIKGFFENSIYSEDLEVTYFALTNVSSAFFGRIRTILSLFPERKLSQKLQIFIHAEDCRTATIFGETAADAIRNEYMLSLEHGMGMFDEDDYNNVINNANDNKTYYVAPFDAILPTAKETPITIFDNKVLMLSNNNMEEIDTAGYKINDTHMRLGSKVHITGFYEMSFLFYRTNIANRFAFEIIRNLIHRSDVNKINILEDKLLFYGYASYSKAILTSIVEMLNAYREYKGASSKCVHFAAYQHNLQVDTTSDEIQMYFSFSPNYLPNENQADHNDSIVIEKDTKIIQIVPISSTLTTFNKMWAKFISSTTLGVGSEKIDPYANYTIFWVVDKSKKDGKPTEIEKSYWTTINLKERTIQTNNLVANDPVFFIRSPIHWYSPLDCDLCYPNTPELEIPLVETDMTSTVPSQQIRPIRRVENKNKNENSEEILDTNDLEKLRNENNARLLALRNCVYYGHLKRGKNHYQYYIDTQRYFHKVEHDIKKWLSTMAKKNPTINITKLRDGEKIVPVLNIIFTPEHNTNVGFAQYVNNYYFGGTAEVISINVDKEFRSNFICEHSGLISTVSQLLGKWGNQSVKFHFADDTIISGGTIIRANDLLQSLIPLKFKKAYPIIIFNKCFVLIDRLSSDSKRSYVQDIANDFLSFLHIDISSIRTQGDSCIGCKLQNDAKKLFKRSSTRELANYWSAKNYALRSMDYDNTGELKKIIDNNALERLIVSHIAQNVFFQGSNNDKEHIYNSILALFYCVLDISDDPKKLQEQYTMDDFKLQSSVDKIKNEYNIIFNGLFSDPVGGIRKRCEFAQLLLKVLSRPFFTYDFKVRHQVMRFFLILTESFLTINEEGKLLEIDVTKKEEQLSINVINKIVEMLSDNETNLIRFIQDNLIEPLADMRSTYLIRKESIKKIAKFIDRFSENKCERKQCSKNSDLNSCNRNIIECFWREYAAHIHRLIDCSSDEAKSLWFEYLLLSGLEYKSFKELNKGKLQYEPISLFDSLGGNNLKHNDYFKHFCDELFLLNTRLMFDGIERVVNKKSISADDYFMKHWEDYSNLSEAIITQSESVKKELSPIDPQCTLFHQLNKMTYDKNKQKILNVHNRYKELLEKVASMVQAKYKLQVDVALITYTDRVKKTNKFQDIKEYDIIATEPMVDNDKGIARQHYEIKQNIIKAIGNNLLKYGYYLNAEDNIKKEDNFNQNPYILLYFDNPEFDIQKINMSSVTWDRELKRIAHIFLYLDIKIDQATPLWRKNFFLQMIMRDLLSYRNRLLRFFENDFAGDIYAKFAHTIGEKNILAHEKSYSHTTTSDEQSEYRIISGDNNVENPTTLPFELEMKWLIFRSYTNRQIAKLFNRSFSDIKDKRVDSGTGNAEFTNIHDNNTNNMSDSTPSRYPESHVTNKFMCMQLKEFKDLLKNTSSEDDERGKMLQRIIKFSVSADIKDATFIANTERAYNLEYFKCILCDVFFSALKYANIDTKFLFRIQQCHTFEKNFDIKSKDKRIQLEITRKEGHNCDYLVIKNRVRTSSHNLSSGKFNDENSRIKRRLEDPLDHSDGHMSLFAIKHYVEGLKENSKDKTSFYYKSQSMDGKSDIIFVTELPVLVKRGMCDYE